ncbi:MAG: bifunctional response regulator/alkaline phosphatase family protein, partial [Gemmatimonadetes bacterium]|nr:bifunctional response regulator/alkaline phosphatase family protein [Gemmatimonadota bacterium]
MRRAAKRILWVDDEIDLLRPHLLFLQQRGYQVDAVSNGDDALALLRGYAYDLILLDEQMPGRRGLEVLEMIRRDDPHARVVMVTKSEEDRTMTEAIGRQVEDYLVKPTSPRQVLSVVTRILEGSSIQQQRAAQDFAKRWPALTRMREQAAGHADFARIYQELVEWHLRLEGAGETGLRGTVEALHDDLRHDFGRWVTGKYPSWVWGEENPPEMSVDIVERRLLPLLGKEPVFFVVLDCMRLDQWRAIAPLLSDSFDVDEGYHYSILPTATPYARNAIFAGRFPDEIARE